MSCDSDLERNNNTHNLFHNQTTFMNTYIVLLRGINVSGKNKIKMAELRSALEDAGFSNVESYIQSGNIILDSKIKESEDISRAVEDTIQSSFGLEVPAITLAPSLMEEAIKKNPFLERGVDTKTLLLAFLWNKPEAEHLASLETVKYPPDEILINDRLVYYYLPQGSAGTKFTIIFLERRLKTRATSRNWRTCNTLMEMCKLRSPE